MHTFLKSLLILSFSALLNGCNVQGKKKMKTNITQESKKNNSSITQDTIYLNCSVPLDSLIDYLVQPIGEFHGEETWDKKNYASSIGLFFNKNKFYLKKTSASYTFVNDPIMDENEDDKTGIVVKSNSNDSCIVLLSNKLNLKSGNVKNVLSDLGFVDEKHTFKFEFENKKYEFYIENDKRKINGNWEPLSLLKMRCNEKQRTLITEFASSVNYEEYYEANIRFIGDLNGDGLLDYLIEELIYNGAITNLYLSSKGKKDNSLKLVARHMSSGC
jgi:hypothetical protein